MDFLLSVWDLILHLDRYLEVWVQSYGAGIYLILFLIVFCETGLVVTPFLPGDSLFFIAGSLAALGGMNVHALAWVLASAAILGNLTNYSIGNFFGKKFFIEKNARFLNPEWLAKTHAFYEKWGGLAVVLGRFVPFFRTYVPFVAGVASMSKATFMVYTIFGAIAWVCSLTYLGYFFGNIPWIKNNQGFLVLGIIIFTTIPVLIPLFRRRRAGHATE
ncbi:MAG: VTT domain-containing protein [Betaproteobacteria bacterium]|nr:VTT domain-containing protein [Betaproteobacteria bacterium]